MLHDNPAWSAAYLAIFPQEDRDIVLVHSDDDAALPSPPILLTDDAELPLALAQPLCFKHLEASVSSIIDVEQPPATAPEGVHPSSRPQRTCKRKQKVCISSSSSEEKVPTHHASAPAPEGVHLSLRPVRKCKVEKVTSSSEGGATPLPQQSFARARAGVHSSLRPQRTCKVEEVGDSSISSSDESDSFFEGITFKAKDSIDAKKWLAKSFDDNHLGGHNRCINSRSNYVYFECKRCKAKCAASLKQGSKWVVSKAPSSGPCTGVSASSSVSRAPSVSVSLSTAPVTVAHLPPAAAAVEQEVIECCMCFDADVPSASTVSCRNAGKHAYCQECFGNHIKNLCEKRAEFMKDEGRIFCMKCRMEGNPSSEDFDMQAAGAK